jgi:hypothetical protein
MWLAFLTSVFLLIITLGGKGLSEWSSVRSAEEARSGGRAREAVARFEEVIVSDPLFYRDADLRSRQAHAAYEALLEAQRSQQFLEADRLVNLIAGSGTTHLQSAVQAIAARLPEQHLDFATTLLQSGDPDRALHESALVRRLYPREPWVLARVQMLEGQVRLDRIDRLLTHGDFRGILRMVKELEGETHLALKAGLQARVREAISRGADEYVASNDYPGLFRWLAGAREALKPHVHLLREVHSVQTRQLQQLFDVPVSVARAALTPEDVPSPVYAGLAPSGIAVLRVKNHTGRHLTVHVRGLDDHRASIAPRSRVEIRLSAGEYVQFAHAGPRVRPYLGIIQVSSSHAYHQTFEIGRMSREAPEASGDA